MANQPRSPGFRVPRILDLLTRPHPSISDYATQTKSRLLAYILLVMFVVFSSLDGYYLLTLPVYSVTWYGYIFLVTSFTLNRIGKYRLASALTLAMFPLVIFSSIASGDSANPLSTLNITILCIMLGSILVSPGELLLLAAVNLIGMAIMPSFVPEQLPGLSSIVGPASNLLIGTALAFILMHERDRIEAARQKELRANEERLQMALRAGKMGAWEWDIPTGKVHWSKDVESLFGLKPGQFAGTYEAYLDLLSPEDDARVRRSVDEAIRSEAGQYHIIHSVRTPEGRERWLEGRASVVRDEAGGPMRLIGTVADITSRVEADAERSQLLGKMERRSAHLNTASRVSKFSNLILDQALLIQQACNMIAEGFDLYYVGLFLIKDRKAILQAGYGEPGQAMVNEGYFLPLNEHSMIGWSIINHQARIAQHALNDEVRRINPLLPDTRSEMAIPLICRGRVIGALTIQSAQENAFDEGDITILQTMSDQIAISIENARLFSELQNELQHRLQIELELERERDFAVLVMSALGQGVIVTDAEGKLEYVNPAFARMIGLTQEQILGKRTEEFVHPDDRDKWENARSPERKTSSFEARFMRSNGLVAHVLITSSPRRADDRSHGSVSAMIDLTERKQAEIERETLIRELEGKNAELERFTYTVSHDLKSPLITIRGFLGYLLTDAEQGDLDRMRDDSRRITDATNRMQRLLDDLLELSRIGRLMNPPEEIPFAQIVQEALALVEGRIIQGRINVRISPRLPVVRVDRVRMVEALQNLLDNAAKFMGDQPNPVIEVGVREDSGHTVLFVKDNGIGIEPQYHEKIFGLFNKLDRTSEGTGVGLALVKRIIEVHDGKIWLESTPGKGTVFYFTVGHTPL